MRRGLGLQVWSSESVGNRLSCCSSPEGFLVRKQLKAGQPSPNYAFCTRSNPAIQVLGSVISCQIGKQSINSAIIANATLIRWDLNRWLIATAAIRLRETPSSGHNRQLAPGPAFHAQKAP
jgi:hypothetical protein